jgi:hypothetical protein
MSFVTKALSSDAPFPFNLDWEYTIAVVNLDAQMAEAWGVSCTGWCAIELSSLAGSLVPVTVAAQPVAAPAGPVVLEQSLLVEFSGTPTHLVVQLTLQATVSTDGGATVQTPFASQDVPVFSASTVRLQGQLLAVPPPESHDTVVLPAAPLRVVVPRRVAAVSRRLAVAVVNADANESPGDTIRLHVDKVGCPDSLLVTGPTFRTEPIPGDSAVLAGGQKKTAMVDLRITHAAFLTPNPLSPARCTLRFTANRLPLGSTVDPHPENNSVDVTLDVVDKGD